MAPARTAGTAVGVPKIDVDTVSVRFPAPLPEQRSNLALSGVSVRVAPGEFVAILGRARCGKSTLLRVVSGLVVSTEGTVRLDGQAVDPGAGHRVPVPVGRAAPVEDRP